MERPVAMLAGQDLSLDTFKIPAGEPDMVALVPGTWQDKV